MSKTATNLIIVLGLITVAFAGYYLYTQRDATTLDTTATNEQTMQEMLASTRSFIEYRRVLSGIRLDVSLFENDEFNSLRTFSTPVESRPVGRPNPFAEVEVRGSDNKFLWIHYRH